MRATIARCVVLLFAGVVSSPGRTCADSKVLWSSVNAHGYQRIDILGPFSWPRARDSASARGCCFAGLACVTSAIEDSIVRQLVYPTADSGIVYFGGADQDQPGSWSWVSGEPWSYTAWDSTRLGNGGGDQHYLSISQAGWDDVYGSYPNPLSQNPGPVSYVVEWGIYCPCAGDPHCDSIIVDIIDVRSIINYAFQGFVPPPDPLCPWERGDVDCSGATDVLDVTRAIDVAFRGADANVTFCFHPWGQYGVIH